MCHIPYFQRTLALFRRIQGRCGIQGSLAEFFSPTRWIVCQGQAPSPANHGWAFSNPCGRPQDGSEISSNICVVFTSLYVFEARAYRYSITRVTYVSAHASADEDEYLNQASTHLGEIRVDIKRVQALELGIFQPSSSVLGHGKVHERSKKAVTHCVSCVDCIVLSAATNTENLQVRPGSGKEGTTA